MTSLTRPGTPPSVQEQDLERATGDRPAPPEQALDWLRQVARALGKAHEAGLVHRDLKPENLFLTRGENGAPLVKVLDFGIAKMAAEASALTASDTFLGTPGYMAPEQTDSRGPPITYRADLYALGLIAFKLLTGHSYWRGGSLAQLLAQILAEPMPPASERGSTFGPAFDDWFRRACDRVPERRYASAGEQVEALAAALGLPEAPRTSHPTPMPPSPTGEQGAPSLNGSFTDLSTARRRRTARRLFGGGVAATAMGAGLGIALLHGAGTREARSPSDVGGAGMKGPPPVATAPAGLPSTLTPEDSAAGAAPTAPSLAPPGSAAAPASSLAVATSASAAASGAAPATSAPHRTQSSPAASSRAPRASASSRGRDPLDGPW